MTRYLYRHLRRLARTRLAHPTFYRLTRRCYLTLLRVTHRVDEEDFRAFAHLGIDDGLILDVGANGGQTAVALAFLTPRAHILSFEPNPTLASEMRFLRRLLGRRFEFRLCALGDARGRFELHVPVLGRLPMTTRASLLPDAARAHADELQRIYRRPIKVEGHAVDVLPIDHLRIDPTAIKIDVEGFERQVLEGARETIARARPVIMLERNADTPACETLLTGLNYQMVAWSPAHRRFTMQIPVTARNCFALPRERLAQLPMSDDAPAGRRRP